MPPDTGRTLFAVARIAGWAAHYLEELGEPRCASGPAPSTARKSAVSAGRGRGSPRRRSRWPTDGPQMDRTSDRAGGQRDRDDRLPVCWVTQAVVPSALSAMPWAAGKARPVGRRRGRACTVTGTTPAPPQTYIVAPEGATARPVGFSGMGDRRARLEGGRVDRRERCGCRTCRRGPHPPPPRSSAARIRPRWQDPAATSRRSIGVTVLLPKSATNAVAAARGRRWRRRWRRAPCPRHRRAGPPCAQIDGVTVFESRFATSAMPWPRRRRGRQPRRRARRRPPAVCTTSWVTGSISCSVSSPWVTTSRPVSSA